MKVRACGSDDEAFVGIKRKLYQNLKWSAVPEPDGEFLDSCWVVEQDGQVFSRAALFINPDIQWEGKRMAQVGSFESLENEAAVKLLMKHLSAKAKALGFDALLGPMNGSTWHSYRFNCHHQRPFFTEIYHPEYYPRLWQGAGFKQWASYYSSLSEDILNKDFPRLTPKEGITLRELDLKNYEAELGAIHAFCNEAFAKNFLFTPISVEDFLKLYLPLKSVIDPRLVILAEKDGALVGLMFCLPDHYNAERKRAIIKTLARKPEREFAGLGHILSAEFYRTAQNLGYRDIIHAFMLEEGNAKVVSGDFFGEPFRKYGLMTKDI